MMRAARLAGDTKHGWISIAYILGNVGGRSVVTFQMEPNDQERALPGWIEADIGKFSRFERLPRWRASWAAEVEQVGGSLALFVKGGGLMLRIRKKKGRQQPLDVKD